jgi:hypothetical protein
MNQELQRIATGSIQFDREKRSVPEWYSSANWARWCRQSTTPMNDRRTCIISPYQGDAKGGGRSPIRPPEHQERLSSAHLKARERETEGGDLYTNLKESHEY